MLMIEISIQLLGLALYAAVIYGMAYLYGSLRDREREAAGETVPRSLAKGFPQFNRRRS